MLLVSAAMLPALLVLLTLLVSTQSNDSVVLLELKNHTDDQLATLGSWSTAISFCQWSGVTCSSENRVVALHLRSLSSLSGSDLATAIQSLSKLGRLHITNSSVSGSISPRKCSLEVVELSSNQIQSSFPGDLVLKCKQIKLLNLSHSQFDGEILNSGNKMLETLDLSYNNFNGSISGSLFSSCKNLHHLDLSNNQLSGSFPSSEIVSFNSRLKFLDISHNKFTGDFFPSNLLKSLRSLENVYAGFNNFTGEVPAVGNNIRYLDLSSNMFEKMTTNICSTPSKLEILLLANNKLAGNRVLEKASTDCALLEMLDVSFNSIAGEIPGNLCDQTPRLRHLLAWGNNLQGQIPPGLAACTNLSIILLSYNNLSGEIPPQLFHELIDLQWLSLSDNRLTGPIPTLDRLKNLLVFQLSNNRLNGSLPGNMEIQVVELKNNFLSGEIPANLGFTGQKLISARFLGNLRTVVFASPSTCIDFGTFIVQGILVSDLEKLLGLRSGCPDLNLNFLPASTYSYNVTSPQHIDVSNNKLVGAIPSGIGEMQGLQNLNLGSNMLTGSIPPEIAMAKNLMSLNLSNNQLRGRIPDPLAMLSFLVVFDVSNNNLSGVIPRGGQFATFTTESYRGNPALCGEPLPSKCGNNQSRNLSTQDDVDDDDELGIYLISSAFGGISFAISSVATFFIFGKWSGRMLL